VEALAHVIDVLLCIVQEIVLSNLFPSRVRQFPTKDNIPDLHEVLLRESLTLIVVELQAIPFRSEVGCGDIGDDIVPLLPPCEEGDPEGGHSNGRCIYASCGEAGDEGTEKGWAGDPDIGGNKASRHVLLLHISSQSPPDPEHDLGGEVLAVDASHVVSSEDVGNVLKVVHGNPPARDAVMAKVVCRR